MGQSASKIAADIAARSAPNALMASPATFTVFDAAIPVGGQVKLHYAAGIVKCFGVDGQGGNAFATAGATDLLVVVDTSALSSVVYISKSTGALSQAGVPVTIAISTFTGRQIAIPYDAGAAANPDNTTLNYVQATSRFEAALGANRTFSTSATRAADFATA